MKTVGVSVYGLACSVGRYPLNPAFSPNGGEGVRRTDEGDDGHAILRQQHFLIRSKSGRCCETRRLLFCLSQWCKCVFAFRVSGR